MDRTALLSVYDKKGVVEFAEELRVRGWNILGSRGTVNALRAADIPAKDVAEIVGNPILGHRVVTLSREVHAGLLAQDTPADNAELHALNLLRIDLVYVNLYPLEKEIAKPGSTRASVIEMTDVGGPTLLHASAKGERIVIGDPADCQDVLNWLDAGCPDRERFIDRLNAKAHAIAADYLLTAARYRSQGRSDGMVGTLVTECKYGENGWQIPAGLYGSSKHDPLALSNFNVIEGNAPSYNNFCDIDRMLQTTTHIAAAFDTNWIGLPLIAVGVKHGNACGAAIGNNTIDVAYRMAMGDNRAIFGGLVMTTFPIDETVARILLHGGMPAGQKRLLDGIVAPHFRKDGIDLLVRKGGKCRLLENPALQHLSTTNLDTEPRLRKVRGGFLKQPNYTFVLNTDDPQIQRFGVLSEMQKADLLLAWAVGSTSNSNTVTLVKGGQLIGNGVGQQDRVGCCELAIKRARDAGHDPWGSIAYSDSFFPFVDGPRELIKAGIAAILTSSGSIRDKEVQALCREYEIPLVMIPDALGRGFYNH